MIAMATKRLHNERRTQSSPPAGRAPLVSGATLAAAAILSLVGTSAYFNSFGGEFIFDDIQAILENPNIESIWPLSKSMSAPHETTVSGRPIVSLSLALNYLISSRRVWSYHAFNLAVHVLAGITLFGIIRRTLLSGRLKDRFGQSAWPIAVTCAAIWLAHPVGTQAVTYVIQRAESMMALFCLVTLYCAIRSFQSKHRILWQLAAVFFCGVGMGTKETMVTVPVLVLVYDGVFSGLSFRNILRNRWKLYLMLAGTWTILAFLMYSGPRQGSAGFGLQTFTPLTYAQTQCGAILHYIRLAFWPSPLVLDYQRKIATSFGDYALQGSAVIVLLSATVLALRYWPAVGFLGAWFFLILSPTSSFVPIADPVFEHRMYLPLAAIVSAVVVTAWLLFRRLLSESPKAALITKLTIVVATVGLLAGLTYRRNCDYRTRISIWTDTVAKQPGSRRAHLQLGGAYRRAGQYDQAIASSTRSLAIDPNYPRAYLNRGIAYAVKGLYPKAISDLQEAIRLDPDYYLAYANRGVTYLHMGQYRKAIQDFNRAIELRPRDPWLRQGLQEAFDLMRQADSAATGN